MRGPDKEPRKRRTRAEIEATRGPGETVNEFMPTRGMTVTDGPEAGPPYRDEPEVPPTVNDLAAWAKRILSSPENREGIEAAFKAGKLSATMFAWLKEQAELVKEENAGRQKMRTMMEAATSTEVKMIANICRRAMGREESLIWAQGARRGRTNDEIIRGIL